MTRAQQRELGALVFCASRAIENGLSTLPTTIHLSADMMEHLSSEGVGLLADYTARERRHMAGEGRAMPDGSFPIANCDAIPLARNSVSKVPERQRDNVLSFIHRRAFAFNC